MVVTVFGTNTGTAVLAIGHGRVRLLYRAKPPDGFTRHRAPL